MTRDAGVGGPAEDARHAVGAVARAGGSVVPVATARKAPGRWCIISEGPNGGATA
ncbi:hypothetical protein OG592_38555 [Streptomyces avidinii]|uniref:hypothetical protein n=1 Tax=Streptomyces avidinii TaxID=1895 RepID=UPI00386C4679|nr:hypothetical protein OG592_38555 [Streptomyces avidinii]